MFREVSGPVVEFILITDISFIFSEEYPLFLGLGDKKFVLALIKFDSRNLSGDKYLLLSFLPL